MEKLFKDPLTYNDVYETFFLVKDSNDGINQLSFTSENTERDFTNPIIDFATPGVTSIYIYLSLFKKKPINQDLHRLNTPNLSKTISW